MKTAILSNGNLNIGLNEFGLVSDFYFPDNGYENHTLGEDLFHRVGVMTDSEFSWLHGGDWSFAVEYLPESLISKTVARNERLQIQLEFIDFVVSDFDIFARKVQVRNLANEPRNFKLFFHQNFSINGGRHLADTAQFLPEPRVILHYRGKRAFVVSAQKVNFEGEKQTFEDFHQYTVGLFGIENKLGSWLDAEDGILSGCNVEHGQTDSVVGFDFNLKANELSEFRYAISVADGHDLAFENYAKIRENNFEKVFAQTKKYWQKWLAPAVRVSKKLPEKYQKKFLESLLLVKSHIAKSGAPIASNDSEMLRHARDDYSYCWPRDALYAIWPLIRLGYRNEPQKFFEFCRDSLNADGFLAHKYLPNGELGPSWHPYSQGGDTRNLPIQIDETAGVLFLLGQFYRKFSDRKILDEFYENLAKPMANFLIGFLNEEDLPKANYELWEMDFLSTTYTTSVVFAALRITSDLAREFGQAKDSEKWKNTAEKIRESAQEKLWNSERQYFYRGIWPSGERDTKIDASSFYGAFLFELLDFNDSRLEKSFETLSNRFDSAQNVGIPRFEHDVYYRFSDDYEANIWPIASLWRAEFLLSKGEKAEAEKILDWVTGRSSSTGVLPEQIDPRDLSWKSVAPLTWSQAEFVSALLDLISMQE